MPLVSVILPLIIRVDNCINCLIGLFSGTVEIPIDNRLHIQNNDVKRAKPNNYATVVHTKLYGDLTPIVTTVAPCKRPDETIGLNDLHPNEPKPNDSYQPQQHQSKDEDRWDKFIECLLFFCCVA